jgi:hypothetical protein
MARAEKAADSSAADSKAVRPRLRFPVVCTFNFIRLSRIGTGAIGPCLEEKLVNSPAVSGSKWPRPADLQGAWRFHHAYPFPTQFQILIRAALRQPLFTRRFCRPILPQPVAAGG